MISLSLACAAAWACADTISPINEAAIPERAAAPLLDWTAGCGVAFTAAMTYEDDLLTAYGIPGTSDTIQFCETWTGSDYFIRETTIGSAFNAFQEPDTARTIEYSGGLVRGYAADGGPAHGNVSVGPTAFDFMQVDEATRQASYDDPYWAVYSDGSGNPCPPPQLQCRAPGGIGLVEGAASPDTTAATPDSARPVREFKRHGLSRRGLRALVENATELARSPEGHRRFRLRRGSADVVLTLDRVTELLIGEETTSEGRMSRTSHQWKRHGARGYVREQTVAETVEDMNGRAVRSRRTTTITNFTRGAGVVPTATAARPETDR